MFIRVTVKTPHDVARAAGLYPKELAVLWECSPSLVQKKMSGGRPWFRQEVKVFHEALKARGIVISARSLVSLFEPGQIVDRPLWSRRDKAVTGGAGR